MLKMNVPVHWSGEDIFHHRITASNHTQIFSQMQEIPGILFRTFPKTMLYFMQTAIHGELFPACLIMLPQHKEGIFRKEFSYAFIYLYI